MPTTSGRSPSDEEMTPYQQLVRDARKAKGMSYPEVQRRSGLGPDGKPRVSRQNAWRIENRAPTDRPDPVTLEGLAAALDLGIDTLRDAVSESLDLRVLRGRDPQMDRLADAVKELPAENRERWLRLARALADALALEDERPMTATSQDNVSGDTDAQAVAIDRSIGSHGELIVQAGPDGSAPPTPEEQEYLDTISDAALERMRRRRLSE